MWHLCRLGSPTSPQIIFGFIYLDARPSGVNVVEPSQASNVGLCGLPCSMLAWSERPQSLYPFFHLPWLNLALSGQWGRYHPFTFLLL